MSELENIGNHVIDLRRQINGMSANLSSDVVTISSKLESLKKIMEGTVQSNYSEIVLLLNNTSNDLDKAISNLINAAEIIEDWIESHITVLSVSGTDDTVSENILNNNQDGSSDFYKDDLFNDAINPIDVSPISVNEDVVNTNLYSKEYNTIINLLKELKIDKNSLEPYSNELSEEEIIHNLGGVDRTKGSCSSLAFAYAGIKGGYNVLDYRGGQSRRFFSSDHTIEMIANLPNLKSIVEKGKNDFEFANQLINEMEYGKEYYFASGRHAAIIRRTKNGDEYLELQSIPGNNGWKKLNNDVLKTRFGCKKHWLIENTSFLIDLESLSTNKEFLDILEFINTA